MHVYVWCILHALIHLLLLYSLRPICCVCYVFGLPLCMGF
jgi:hypothetical protein